MRVRTSFKIVLLVVSLALAAYASYLFITERYTYDTIYPSSSFTELRHLSDYNPELKNAFYDSPILVFDSGVEGENVLVVGGTHPNEIAGVISSYFIAENAEVTSGKLFVIPVLNYSGHSSTESGKGSFPSLRISNRTFSIGSRIMSPLDSWPDPFIYAQLPSKVHLGSDEGRNINRGYPGEGFLPSVSVARSVMNLLEEEDIDLAYDLHEASVTYPVNRVIISDESGFDAAYLASLLMKESGFDINAEVTQESNIGYSHHEWGKIDGVLPFLVEVPSPSVDRIQGPQTETLVLDGKDELLISLSDSGYTFGSYGENGISLDERVALHAEAILSTFSSASALGLKDDIGISFPSGSEILDNGLSYYFSKAKGDGGVRVR